MMLVNSFSSVAFILSLGLPVLATTNQTETIQVSTNQPLPHVVGDVQAWYDIRNKTFALPAHFGPGAHISQLYMSNSTDDIPSEFQRENQVDHLHKSPDFGNRLITYEQQVFIAGEMCNFLATISPYIYTFVGMKVQNLACGTDFSYTCTGFWGITNTAAGAYIGDGIIAMCEDSYDSLIAACGEKGGAEEVKIKQTGKSFWVKGYANSDLTTTCTSVGRTTCETLTCDGQCDPNGGTP
ncbi:hypothetical protein N7513_001954 [Penicillium frequentans]|nr:hypothetical protein N7513_001954 [Penicillium glabrum]